MTRGNVDTAPDGFYSVCAIGQSGVVRYFWAAWWSSSGLSLTPAPDAHGIAERIEAAHAQARAAVRAAKGPRASVLSVDAELAVQAARVVRPASPGYQAGAEWWGEDPARHAREESARARRRDPRSPPQRTWLAVLGLAWPCTAADVRRAYRRLALQRHPDRGGTDASFDALTKARDAALREVEAVGS